MTRPARLLMAALAVAALATPVRARAQGADCLVIETFADSQIGQFPLGWKALKDAGKVSYTVQEEAGLRFLRAMSSGLGIQAGREYEWDLTKYPVLAWSWRPRLFPRRCGIRYFRWNHPPRMVGRCLQDSSPAAQLHCGGGQ